jgi:hypothetical protein
LRRRFERAKSEGDLPKDADDAALARFVTALFQGMTVQAINGASRKELLRLAETALRYGQDEWGRLPHWRAKWAREFSTVIIERENQRRRIDQTMVRALRREAQKA